MIFYPHTSLNMCSNAHLFDINSASRLWLPALLYLLHSCSRVRIFASSYVQDVRYADFAGAKIGANKISIRIKRSRK